MKKIFLASLISLFFGGLIGWFLSGFGKDISSFVFGEKYPDAPLGLQWGMTAAELRSKAGAVLLSSTINDKLFLYSLTYPPMTLPNITEYLVLVHKDLGAIKVTMNEEMILDESGTKGKEEYFKYKKALSYKYGKPTDSIESIEKGSDEFYQCVTKLTECSYYSSAFGDHLSLELKGNGRKGRLIITYKSELYTQYNEDLQKRYQNNVMKGL